MLNCRLKEEVRQPIRIVVDSGAGLEPACRLVETAGEYRTIVAHTRRAPEEKLSLLRRKGVELLLCPEEEGRVELKALLKQLAILGIDSVLLEGGGQLNEAFLRNGFVDEVCAFIAPKIIGGKEAKTPVEGRGIARMDDAIVLQDVVSEMVGRDVLLRGKIIK